MSLHVPSSCTYCFHVLFPRIGWHRSTPSVSIDRWCITKVLHACCRQRSKAKRENKPTTKSASNTNQSNGMCSSNTCCRSPLCIVDHRIECNAHNHARNHMYSHRVMLHTCTHVRFNMCELIDSTWHPIARVINLACNIARISLTIFLLVGSIQRTFKHRMPMCRIDQWCRIHAIESLACCETYNTTGSHSLAQKMHFDAQCINAWSTVQLYWQCHCMHSIPKL